MELSHLVKLISELTPNSSMNYVRGDNSCTFVKIDTDNNRLHARTPEGKDISFAESFLFDLADKIVENRPFNTIQLLNNKGSNRAVVDSIIANTSEMYWLDRDRSRYTVWIPSHPHKAGELVEWTNEIDASVVLSEMDNSNLSMSSRNVDVIIMNNIGENKFDAIKLGLILKNMYEESSKDRSSVAAIHLFGLKYGTVITKQRISVAEIVNRAGISNNYVVEVSKGIKLSELISKNCFNTAFWNPSMIIKREPINNIHNSIVQCDSIYRPYLTAIKSKPFLLLAGISGTGKSRIVRELARACWDADSEEYKAQKPKNFEMVQVKPNWHDSGELIGYVSRVSGKAEFVAGDFLKFVVNAWEDLDTPYFLCLDEMNLAPVEQYFAEYLSVVESRKRNEEGMVVTDPILKKANEEWYFNLTASLTSDEEIRTQFNDEGISLPQNLIVVGTVNMDETTFSFSRKVLDRAMTIEMNEVDLYAGLTDRHEEIGKIGNSELVGTAVEGVEVYADNKDVCDEAIGYLAKLNEILEGTPFKVAYRTRNEFLLYVVNNLPYCKDKEGKELPQGYVIARALDEITSMKILSRIEGDDTKVKESLLDNMMDAIKDGLSEIAGEENLVESISIAKLKEMKDRLSSGYTSFWS